MVKKSEIEVSRIKSIISNLRGLYNILESSNSEYDHLKNSIRLLKHTIDELIIYQKKLERDLEL